MSSLMVPAEGYETLSTHIEPLVDAVGKLILAASNKDIKTLQEACQGIQFHLTEVVKFGANYAIQNDEEDFQIELKVQVNKVGDVLEKLIPAFALFLQDKTKSIEIASAYALVAKELGESVNDLIIVADYSGSQKLLSLVNSARKNAKQLKREIDSDPVSPNLGQTLRSILQTQKLIEKQARLVTKTIVTEEKRNLVSARSEDVHNQVTKVVTGAQTLLKGASPNRVSEVSTHYETLMRRYQKLEDVLRSRPDFSSHFNALYEQAILLLTAARNLQLAGQKLMEVAKEALLGSDEFVKAATATAIAAKKLADAAELGLENISDPGRRYQIQQAIRKVLDTSSALIQDARRVAADPSNPELHKILEQSYANLDHAIQDLLLVSDMEDKNILGKIHFGTKAAHELSDALNDRSTAVKNAKLIHAITKNLCDDARSHAKKMDPESAAQILKDAASLQQIADHLLRAAEKWEQTGSDSDFAALDRVRETYQKALQVFRKHLGLNASLDVRPAVRIDLTPPLPQCVIEARKEVEEAREIADFAIEIASSYPGGENHEKILKGAELLRQLGSRLLQACEDVENHPFEKERVQEVEALREKLKRSSAAILQHATQYGSEQASEEIPHADLPPEEKASHEAVTQMDEIMSSLEKLMNDLLTMDDVDFIEGARLIATQVKAVTKLMTIASQKLEGGDVERIKNLNKVLVDSSIQAKILASVVTAEKQSNQPVGDSFLECAKGLMGDLQTSKKIMEDTSTRATASVRKQRMQRMLELLKKRN